MRYCLQKEEEGIMTIRFKEEEAALACIAVRRSLPNWDLR